MKVKDVKLDEITPYEGNPRDNFPAIPVVRASLERFGWQQPIVIDSDNTIVVGHTRYYAARDLGWDVCPVTVADKLTDDEVRAYRIMDNKSNELATWDTVGLVLELQALRDSDFALALTGFNDRELEDLFADGDDFKPADFTGERLDQRAEVECPKCGEVFHAYKNPKSS